jgi:hypothetical protein
VLDDLGYSIYRGIVLFYGGSAELAAPAITAVTDSSISGKSCATCAIEVFSDADSEGAIYEGTTTAASNITWSIDKSGGVAGPSVTATVTDGTGNSSEFSTPANVSKHKVYLPTVLK